LFPDSKKVDTSVSWRAPHNRILNSSILSLLYIISIILVRNAEEVEETNSQSITFTVAALRISIR